MIFLKPKQQNTYRGELNPLVSELEAPITSRETGFIEGIGTGIGRAAETFGATALQAVDLDEADRRLEQIRQKREDRAAFQTPIGLFTEEVAFGLGLAAPVTAAALATGPALAAATIGAGAISSYAGFTASAKTRLKAEGVDDPETLMKVARAEGLISTVGNFLPAGSGVAVRYFDDALRSTVTPKILKDVATRLKTSTVASYAVTGAGINVAAGAIERGFSSETLKDKGYHEVAEHYDMLDSQGIAVDALLGALFGAFGGRAAKHGLSVDDLGNAYLSDDVLKEAENIAVSGKTVALPKTVEAVQISDDAFQDAVRKAYRNEPLDMSESIPYDKVNDLFDFADLPDEPTVRPVVLDPINRVTDDNLVPDEPVADTQGNVVKDPVDDLFRYADQVSPETAYVRSLIKDNPDATTLVDDGFDFLGNEKTKEVKIKDYLEVEAARIDELEKGQTRLLGFIECVVKNGGA